jgi:hypothetical protein
MDDLRSFAPLRFAVPDAMCRRGVALAVGPDVFAVGDAGELLRRDREGKAIWCRMLLDRAKLPHWRFEAQLGDLFAGRLDHVDWIELKRGPRESTGLLEPGWNDFDRLTPEARLLHTTKRRTQPWKTGLPVGFTLREPGEAGGPAQRLGQGEHPVVVAGAGAEQRPDARRRRLMRRRSSPRRGRSSAGRP